MSGMTDLARFRTAVGELAHRSAVLEASLGIATFGLSGVDQYVGRIAITNSTDGRVKIIKQLLRHHGADDELSVLVNDWLSRVTQAYQKRSQILHSILVPGDDGDGVLLFNQKPLGGDPNRWSISEISELTSELERLSSTAFTPVVLGLMDLYPHDRWAVR